MQSSKETLPEKVTELKQRTNSMFLVLISKYLYFTLMPISNNRMHHKQKLTTNLTHYSCETRLKQEVKMKRKISEMIGETNTGVQYEPVKKKMKFLHEECCAKKRKLFEGIQLRKRTSVYEPAKKIRRLAYEEGNSKRD